MSLRVCCLLSCTLRTNSFKACHLYRPQDEAQRAKRRPLEMFFPFDPYLLKRSSRFLDLKASYVRWRRGHPHTVAAAAASDSDDMLEDERAEDFSDGDSGGRGVGLAGTSISAAYFSQHFR